MSSSLVVPTVDTKPDDNNLLFFGIFGTVFVVVVVVILWFLGVFKHNDTSPPSNPQPSSSSSNPPPPPPLPPPICGGGNQVNVIPKTNPNIIFEENKFVLEKLEQNQILKATFGTTVQNSQDVTEKLCKLLQQKVPDNFSMNANFGDPYPMYSKLLFVWYQNKV
jgi:hypothetical protein